MKHVFGPVPSRRLGNSLGVDLLTHKACTFDCVYCQLGRTVEQTTRRRSFLSPEAVLAEVEQVLDSGVAVDYLTLSGSGEPTLSADLGRVVRALRGIGRAPVAVLTNGSLLGREDVQADLADADLVVPSLDAGTQRTFERVNRAKDLAIGEVARGLRDFTLAYGGGVWLEVMVVAGLNDSPQEAQAIVRALEGARIDKVQLNTVVRAPAEAWAEATDDERLQALAAVLEGLAPVETIGPYARKEHPSTWADDREAVLTTLARRPCGAAELATSLGMNPALVAKLLEEARREGRVERLVVGASVQYRLRSP